MHIRDSRTCGSRQSAGVGATRQRGFTLVEMLIVLGIIAFIATLVGVQIVRSHRTAQRKEAIASVGLIASAVDRYTIDCGSLPGAIGDLRAAPSGAQGWSGPYIKASMVKDPWGTPYALAVPGSDGQLFSVRSLGADRMPGGTGDGKDIDSSE